MWRTLLVCLLLTSCAPDRTSLLHPAKLTGQSPDIYHARFDTTQGSFLIEVRREWSPLGADRFYQLVANGFYDGTRFFRTLPKFVVQWGINPNPQVTKAWKTGHTINDDRVIQSNQRGLLSFATSGPDTRTTQIYVNMADNKRLDARGFSPFGKVIAGMEVFNKLFAGYGEGPPRGNGADQNKIETEGEAYLARKFPNLDKVIVARIVN